jgi:hypothetical protein
MSLPFTDQQCFFIAILAFAVAGFQRGWRRELVTLVSVLLAVFLVRPDSSKSFAYFIARLPDTFGYLVTGKQQPFVPPPDNIFLGQFGSLLLFAAVVALGYFIGNKAFPAKPSTPQERFIGIVPAIISGAFVLAFLSNFFPKNPAGQSQFLVEVQPPDPSNYVPAIFIIAIVAVIVALIAARSKKAAPKK